MKAVSRKQQSLKFELLVPLLSERQPAACTSFKSSGTFRYEMGHQGCQWRAGPYRLRGIRNGPVGGRDGPHPRHESHELAERCAPIAALVTQSELAPMPVLINSNSQDHHLFAKGSSKLPRRRPERVSRLRQYRTDQQYAGFGSDIYRAAVI